MDRRKVRLSSPLIVAALAFQASHALARAEDFPPSRGEASFHLGVFEPRGESDLWRENRLTFTQDRTDFDDLIVGGSFASSLNRFFDFQVGAEYYDSSEVRSEYRDFTFDNGDPIRHRARLRELPIDLTIKLLPFGRTVARGTRGRHVVRPVVPYLGIGGGGLLWDYREQGRFVDTTDPLNPTLFRGDFHGRGLTGSYHALAGVEVQVNEQVAVLLEGRYRWAKASLGADFEGFDRFDLSGGSINAGMSFRF